MKFKPLYEKLVVREIAKEEQKEGSIILVDKGKGEAQIKGEVIAVGTGLILPNGVLVESPVVVGDIVLFNKYSGQEIKEDGITYLIVKQNELIGTYGKKD